MNEGDATPAAIEQAERYLTLGMGMDALEILNGLPEESMRYQRVIELWLECLCHLSAWEEAVNLSESITAELSPLSLFWLAVASANLVTWAGLGGFSPVPWSWIPVCGSG